MVRTYEKHIVEATTPTTTGTVDITVPVGATPVGCIIIAARVTAQSGPESGMSMSWGVSDGTNTYCTSQRSEDSVSTSDAAQSTTTDLVRILDPASGSEDVVGELSTFITNGVRINFSTVDTVAYHYKVILVFGSDTEAFAFYSKPANPQDSSDYVNCGFEPSFVLTSSAGDDTAGTEQANANAVFGIAANDGTDSMSCAGMLSETLQTTSDTKRAKYTGRVNINVRLTAVPLFGGNTTIEDYDSTGFTTYVRLAAFPKGIIGLAIRLPSGLGFVHQVTETFESSLGAATRSGLGFTPAFWYICHSANSVNNDLSNAGSVSVGACDAGLTQFSIAALEQNNVTTTNTQVASNQKVHHLYAHAGGILEEAEITSRASGEYGLSIDDVAPVQRLYSTLIVEEVPVDCSINLELGPISSAATAEEIIDSSIAVALPSISASIDADQLIDSSIAVELPSISAAIEADQLLEVTITASLGPISASIDADQLIDSTINAGLPAVAASIFAEPLYDASVSAGLPSINAAIDADQLIDAVIEASLGPINAELTADQLLEATITAALAAINASIDAEHLLIDATINAGLGPINAELIADQLLEATITASLGPVNAELIADQFTDAEITAGLATINGSLVADQLIDAVIVAGLSALECEIDADHTVFCSIDAGLAALKAELTAEVDTDVDAEITAGLGSIDAAIEADQLIDAEITAGMAALSAALEASTAIEAVIAAALSPIAATLTVDELIDAVIGATLPAVNATLREQLAILGCDVDLLASKATTALLIASKATRASLLGSSDVVSTLLGSSDQVVDRAGSSDRIIDLGGSHC